MLANSLAAITSMIDIKDTDSNMARRFTLAIALLLLGAVQAQERSTSSKKDEIKKLLVSMHMDEAMKPLMTRTFSSLRTLTPEVPERFWKELEKELGKLDGLIDSVADIYDRHFTAKEIADLQRFYSSETGQKMIRTMPAVMAESSEAGQLWGQELSMRVYKRLLAEGYEVKTP